jgi:hypothetical protein
MSKRIYPKRYDPTYCLDVSCNCDFTSMASIREPSVAYWPTMLGLLTIIGDAIAAAPWWGNGEVERWVPEIGSSWVTLDGETYGEVYMVCTDEAGVRPWVMFTDDGIISLADFNEFWRPATVVPTPTAEDWIDPAVQLPEVGEWYWYDYCDGDISAYMHQSGDETWRPGSRWAPVLVGPPPIPDAPDDQAAMYQNATDGRAPVTRSELRNSGRAYLLELPESEFWAHRYLNEGDE